MVKKNKKKNVVIVERVRCGKESGKKHKATLPSTDDLVWGWKEVVQARKSLAKAGTWLNDNYVEFFYGRLGKDVFAGNVDYLSDCLKAISDYMDESDEWIKKESKRKKTKKTNGKKAVQCGGRKECR